MCGTSVKNTELCFQWSSLKFFCDKLQMKMMMMMAVAMVVVMMIIFDCKWAVAQWQSL
jgi:hypothetical protein